VFVPILVTVRFKAWFFGRSLPGIAGSIRAGEGWMSVLSVVCYQMEVFASG
jgi:hypothetical protein